MHLPGRITEKQLFELGYQSTEQKHEYVKIDKDSVLWLGGGYPRFHIVRYPRKGQPDNFSKLHYDKYLEHSAKDGVENKGPIVEKEFQRIGKIIVSKEISRVYNMARQWHLDNL